MPVDRDERISPDVVWMSADVPDSEILTTVRAWVDAVAAGDFNRAFAMTAHEGWRRWSPDLIREVIAGYGIPEPAPDSVVHVVTPIDSARGGPKPRHEVDRWAPVDLGTGALQIGAVWFDLPLDGSWSDVTALFDVRRRPEGIYLVLDQIHVM